MKGSLKIKVLGTYGAKTGAEADRLPRRRPRAGRRGNRRGRALRARADPDPARPDQPRPPRPHRRARVPHGHPRDGRARPPGHRLQHRTGRGVAPHPRLQRHPLAELHEHPVGRAVRAGLPRAARGGGVAGGRAVGDPRARRAHRPHHRLRDSRRRDRLRLQRRHRPDEADLADRARDAWPQGADRGDRLPQPPVAAREGLRHLTPEMLRQEIDKMPPDLRSGSITSSRSSIRRPRKSWPRSTPPASTSWSRARPTPSSPYWARPAPAVDSSGP